MAFPNIDFDQLMGLYNSMSEEERDQAKDLASKIMSGEFNPFAAAQNPSQDTEEEDEEEETDEEEYSYLDQLGLGSDRADEFDKKVLSALEAGVDLENFYEDYPDADLSGSVLFYTKALLYQLRDLYPELCALPAVYTTLTDYHQALAELDTRDNDEIDEQDREALMTLISSALSIQTRALSDAIGRLELDSFKQILVSSDLF